MLNIFGASTAKYTIRDYIAFARNAINDPAKATYSFTAFRTSHLIDYKKICFDFEYDENVSDYYCFRKTLQSAGTQSTVFEVRFYQK